MTIDIECTPHSVQHGTAPAMHIIISVYDGTINAQLAGIQWGMLIGLIDEKVGSVESLCDVVNCPLLSSWCCELVQYV